MEWLDERRSAAPMTCAYCGCSDSFAHAKSFEYIGRTFALHRCPSCGSMMYDPPETLVTIEVPYSEPYKENTRVGLKYSLETGYSADMVALCALSAFAGLDEDRLKDCCFVDIGAGIGLSSFLASELYGVETISVEPSYTGELSGELLGIHAYTAFFDALPESVIDRLRMKPCLLHLNSVVEHLREPFTTVRSFAALVDIDSFAAIVPNVVDIDFDGPFASALPYLSPGDHLHLPTRQGMERFMARLGFAHIAVNAPSGLLIAVGARTPITLPGEREVIAVRDRLLHRLRRHPNPLVADGAASRLLPISIVDREGNVHLLSELREHFVAAFDPDALRKCLLDGSAGWPDLPFHLPTTCFWLGFDALDRDQHGETLRWFDVCEAAADRLAVDHPVYAFQALEFKWAARVHRARALRAMERHGEAEACLQSVLDAQRDAVRGPRQFYVEEATRKLSELRLPVPEPRPAAVPLLRRIKRRLHAWLPA